MKFEIKDSRKGIPIYKLLKKKMSLYVGYFGGENEDKARNLSMGSAEHWEFIGSNGEKVSGEGYPARPFLEDFFEEGYSDSLKGDFEEFWKGLIRTGTATGEKLGNRVCGAIRNFVETNPYFEESRNSTQVEKEKGFNHPLIRTGDMMESLTFKFITEDKPS